MTIYDIVDYTTLETLGVKIVTGLQCDKQMIGLQLSLLVLDDIIVFHNHPNVDEIICKRTIMSSMF